MWWRGWTEGGVKRRCNNNLNCVLPQSFTEAYSLVNSEVDNSQSQAPYTVCNHTGGYVTLKLDESLKVVVFVVVVVVVFVVVVVVVFVVVFVVVSRGLMWLLIMLFLLLWIHNHSKHYILHRFSKMNNINNLNNNLNNLNINIKNNNNNTSWQQGTGRLV